MPNSIDDAQNDDATTNDGQQPPVIDHNSPADSDDPEFAGMSDRERALVTRARGDEKRKLYKRQKEQDQQIADLRAQIQQLQQQPPPATPRQAETRNDKIDALAETMQRIADAQAATNKRIDDMNNAEVERRRKAELRQYAVEQISEFRQTHPGQDLIEGFVGGDSEEEIDDSVKIANAEWKLAIQKHEARQGGSNRNGAPSQVTVQNGNGRRPAGTPPVQVANSVEADNNENIDELTSDDAVRSGSYAKNRNQLLGKLKRGYRYTGNQAG